MLNAKQAKKLSDVGVDRTHYPRNCSDDSATHALESITRDMAVYERTTVALAQHNAVKVILTLQELGYTVTDLGDLVITVSC